MHSSQVSNGLCHLVHLFIWTGPVQDPHLEQAKEDRIINTSPINLSEPFHPSDHVYPKPIVKVEIWVHIPPPPIVNDSLIVQFTWFFDPVEGVLGNLSISVSVLLKRMMSSPHSGPFLVPSFLTTLPLPSPVSSLYL